MTIELEQEKFNTLKELAEIQGNVSLAKAELIKLKETAEEYMVVREQEAEERVLKVLKESRDALEETSKNHQELSNYSRDLKAYASELNVISTDIAALFKDFIARMKFADELMTNNREAVNKVLTDIKVERVQIAEDRKMLEKERKETADGFRLLADRREMLERGFEELKKFNNNKSKI